MAFLKKLQQWIHQYRNKDYRKKVQQNKKKTYLFRDYEESFSSSRVGVYQRRKGANRPFTRFFQDLRDRRQDYFRLLNLIGLILLLLSGYIIFFSTFFQITPSRVHITSLDPSIDTNSCYQAIEDLYGKNIFLTDRSTFLTAIQKYQKQSESIQLDYLYPNELKIIVKSLPIVFRFQISGVEKSWGITGNGVLIPSNKIGSGSADLDTLEIISPRLQNTLFLDYKTVLTEERLSTIQKVLGVINSDFSDFHLAKTRYLENEQELHLTLESGTRIFLALDDTLKNQLLTLRSFAQSHRDTFLKGDATYVDARIVGKIFTCWNREICKVNMRQLYGNIYE